MKSRSWLLGTLLLSVLLIAGCGRGETITLEGLPTYPQAEWLEPGQNTTADEIRNLLESALRAGTAEGVSVDSRLYRLPGAGDWEGIKTFYADALSGNDWASDPVFVQDAEGFRSTGWSRGTESGEQVLVVILVADPSGTDQLLHVFLISE